MRLRILAVTLLALPALPNTLAAQANPLSSAIRHMATPSGQHLLDAAKAMPAAGYGFRPTPAQMTFGEIIVHIRGDNRTTCSALSGLTPPVEAAPAATAPRDTLVAALARSLTFCHTALEHLSDARMAEPATWYGSKTTRAMPAVGLLMDWSDHYGQLAIYLRLKGILPPTAK